MTFRDTQAGRVDTLMTWTIHLLHAGMAGALLYAAVCQFTWRKLQLHDYGIYTNFLWNSAHGDFFRMLVDQTYLSTHLSFTLLLVAPLFWVWDHPLLLTVVQWACGVAGSLLVLWSSRRHGLSRLLSAALAFLFLGYAYTQMVLTCEFHGVSLYLVLLPWLFHTMSRARRWAWLPFLLLLGLREDAAFMILPFPLLFAIRDRWKVGYVYAAVALIYGILAIKVLFPWLSGITLIERRADLVESRSILSSFDMAGLALRGHALFWLFLPALMLPRRARWAPVVILPSLALAILMFSPLDHHHGLRRHYAAVPFTAVALGLIAGHAGLVQSMRLQRVRALAAVLLVLISHRALSPLPGGLKNREHFNTLNPKGLEGAWAARFIPRTGVLFCDNILAGYCANRADLLTRPSYRPDRHAIDLMFIETRTICADPHRWYAGLLADGDFGVSFYDARYVIARRGGPTNLNAEVLAACSPSKRVIAFAFTRCEDGDNTFAPGCGPARYWPGGRTASRALSRDRLVPFPAGHYVARFRLRTEEPRDAGGGGRIQLLLRGVETPLAEATIAPVSTPRGEFRWQEVPFTLAGAGRVEARVYGEGAPLWLDRVEFDPAPVSENLKPET